MYFFSITAMPSNTKIASFDMDLCDYLTQNTPSRSVVLTTTESRDPEANLIIILKIKSIEPHVSSGSNVIRSTTTNMASTTSMPSAVPGTKAGASHRSTSLTNISNPSPSLKNYTERRSSHGPAPRMVEKNPNPNDNPDSNPNPNNSPNPNPNPDSNNSDSNPRPSRIQRTISSQSSRSSTGRGSQLAPPSIEDYLPDFPLDAKSLTKSHQPPSSAANNAHHPKTVIRSQKTINKLLSENESVKRREFQAWKKVEELEIHNGKLQHLLRESRMSDIQSSLNISGDYSLVQELHELFQSATEFRERIGKALERKDPAGFVFESSSSSLPPPNHLMAGISELSDSGTEVSEVDHLQQQLAKAHKETYVLNQRNITLQKQLETLGSDSEALDVPPLSVLTVDEEHPEPSSFEDDDEDQIVPSPAVEAAKKSGSSKKSAQFLSEMMVDIGREKAALEQKVAEQAQQEATLEGTIEELKLQVQVDTVEIEQLRMAKVKLEEESIAAAVTREASLEQKDPREQEESSQTELKSKKLKQENMELRYQVKILTRAKEKLEDQIKDTKKVVRESATVKCVVPGEEEPKEKAKGESEANAAAAQKWKKKKKELQQKLTQEVHENKTLRDQIEALKSQIKEQVERHDLYVETTSSSVAAASSSAHVVEDSEYKLKCQQMESELKQVLEEMETLQQDQYRVDALEEKLQVLVVRNQDHSNQAEVLQDKIQHLEDERHQMEDLLADMKTARAELQDAQKQERVANEKVSNEMDIQLHRLENDRLDWNRKIQDINSEKEYLKQRQRIESTTSSSFSRSTSFDTEIESLSTDSSADQAPSKRDGDLSPKVLRKLLISEASSSGMDTSKISENIIEATSSEELGEDYPSPDSSPPTSMLSESMLSEEEAPEPLESLESLPRHHHSTSSSQSSNNSVNRSSSSSNSSDGSGGGAGEEKLRSSSMASQNSGVSAESSSIDSDDRDSENYNDLDSDDDDHDLSDEEDNYR